MKRTVYTSLFALVLLAACAENGEKKIVSVEKKIVYTVPTSVSVNRELTVGIQGMSCEHACGGAIRMALKNTKAVERCSFDFDKNRLVNTAKITFDKNKISADELIAIIEKINEGQFSTTSTSSKAMELESSNESVSSPSTSSDSKSKIDVESSSSSFEFPNLFDLFSHIIS